MGFSNTRWVEMGSKDGQSSEILHNCKKESWNAGGQRLNGLLVEAEFGRCFAF